MDGWSARLELHFERREDRTVAAHRSHRGPLRVQKSLWPEGEAVCHQIVLHPPGGLAGGDELELDLQARRDSHALLTTPGAAKWYRSAGRGAVQRTSLTVAEGAALEWLPHENILFSGARAELENRFEVAHGGRLIATELFCLGRPAAGERFRNGSLRFRTEVTCQGRLLFHERAVLGGDDPLLASRIGLGGCEAFGTLLAVGPALGAEMVDVCRALEVPGQLAVTRLPELIVARWMGERGEDGARALRAVWSRLRPLLLGRPAQAPRIWAT